MLARYCPPPHQTGRADLPASGFRHWSSLQSFSESYQSEFPEMGRQCGSFGNSPGSLATSPKVLDHPVFHVPVDLLHGGSTVPFSVIGLPSPQMPVDVSYEFGNRYVLLLIGDHFSHARYLALFRLLTRRNSPVPTLRSVRRRGQLEVVP